MAYDLEEQEQIDAIKSWWTRYGNLVVAVLVAVALAAAGYQGWRYYRQQQSLAAVTLYEQLERAARGGDAKKVRDIAAQIVERYGSSPYAAMAALAAARAAFDTGEFALARTHLQWVAERAKEEEMRDVARLRLAGLLLDEKKHAEALKLLEARHGEAFAGLYADLRGDVLASQGRTAEARAAYRLALQKSDAQSPYHQLVQAKLDALGEAK